ncbi:MAG: hypothetical protein KAQ98_09415 [Bacteriovoracaceae bacterium]|nr:hypothetical protein [Bacteriovoracaceae bacterium]
MDIVNRSSAIIYSTEKMLDWINSLPEYQGDDAVSLEEVNSEPCVFLIPEFEDEVDAYDYIASREVEIFNHMLSGWWQEKGEINVNPDKEDFQEWFGVSVSSMIIDLDYTPIVKDELEVVDDDE